MLANVVGDFLRRTLVLSLREIGAAALEFFCEALGRTMDPRFDARARISDPAGEIFHLAANLLGRSLRGSGSTLTDPLGFSIAFRTDLVNFIALVIFHKYPFCV